MSQIPKSGLKPPTSGLKAPTSGVKPPTVKITTSKTTVIPGTSSVRKETRTVEKIVPASSGATGGSSCTAPCSTGKKQLRPPSAGVSGAPPTSGQYLAVPQARTGPTTPQTPAPSRQIMQPGSSTQMPAPGRQISGPSRQIPSAGGQSFQPVQRTQPPRQIPAPGQISQPARHLRPPGQIPQQQLQVPVPGQIHRSPRPMPAPVQIPAPCVPTCGQSPQHVPSAPAQPRQIPQHGQGPSTARQLRPPGEIPQRPRQLRLPGQIPQSQMQIPALSPIPHQPRQIPAPGQIPQQPRQLPAPGQIPQQARQLPAPSQIPQQPRQLPAPGRVPQQLRQMPVLKPPKTTVEQDIQRAVAKESAAHPEGKVVAKGKKHTKICHPEVIETPAGPEQVLQKAVLEKRIERDEAGERIVKNLAVSEVNERGIMHKRTLGIQQFDPQYPKPDGGREVIGVKSVVSVTPSYKTVSKECVRVTAQPDLGMSPREVAQLVEEEKEDVENTLKMVPPDLELEPGKYEMKQRQQRLRLHSESMALLEQSIIQPTPTADETQAEPTPEAMARVMHTVENGISPQSDPNQVFNSLFDEPTNEQFINVSSVTPGPLQDVVIPTEVPKDIHLEALTDNMTQLTEKKNAISNAEDEPYVDIFTRVMNDEQKSPKGTTRQKPYQPITDEKSLWVNANLEHLVTVVGAEPAEVVDPYDLDELMESGRLEEELASGIDYFVEADPIQYMSRVQLRGTEMPAYFPGYMVALPDFPEVIKIAKSPDEVYASAWKAAQPKYFEEDSLVNYSF